MNMSKRMIGNFLPLQLILILFNLTTAFLLLNAVYFIFSHRFWA